jgi:heat-inducible transcriptional repressor
MFIPKKKLNAVNVNTTDATTELCEWNGRALLRLVLLDRVLHTLEQQYVMVSLVRDMLNRGLSVAIGAEHGVEPLSACSVVLAPVMVDGNNLGTVGVLGPTRMNYPQALATVEIVSDHLGRRLAES